VVRNGKLLLNTKNANYSYGSLQDAFKYVLKKIRIQEKKINNILILGFGCGSIAALFKTQKNIEITGVEADEKVLELYEKYFLEQINSEIILVESFAEDFIVDHKKTYDLILVDVFIDLDVPPAIKENTFFQHINKSLNTGGIFIYNFIVMNESEKIEFEKILNLIQKFFNTVEVIEFMAFNKIIVATK
jgi:spermidine synthase